MILSYITQMSAHQLMTVNQCTLHILFFNLFLLFSLLRLACAVTIHFYNILY